MGRVTLDVRVPLLLPSGAPWCVLRRCFDSEIPDHATTGTAEVVFEVAIPYSSETREVRAVARIEDIRAAGSPDTFEVVAAPIPTDTAPIIVTVENIIEAPRREVEFKRDKRGRVTSATIEDAV